MDAGSNATPHLNGTGTLNERSEPVSNVTMWKPKNAIR